MWIVAPDACGGSCETVLAQAEQLHTLLHKDVDRVRRALLAGVGGPLPSPGGDVAAFAGDLALLDAGVYIVDPLGNLVLWYSYDDVGKPLLDDLKRLLKVSQIG